ncbi:hypothetical protein [Spirosoma aerophilum]
MQNPFEIIVTRLSNIEALLLDIKHPTVPTPPDADPYGDFKWLAATCTGIPSSTLRIHSASGRIPGVVRFGKRVLYEKAVVLNWLRSQTRQPIDMTEVERVADLQVNAQLSKRSQKEGVKG